MLVILFMDSITFMEEWISLENGLRGWFFRVIRSQRLDLSYVDDFVQETFLKAYESRESYREDGSFGAWLFRIGRNLWVDYYRKEKLIRFDCSEDLNRYVVDSNQEEIVFCSELGDRIKKEVIKFPNFRWKGIFRGMVEEKNFRDIADENDCALGTVCSSVSRIREYLRPSLF